MDNEVLHRAHTCQSTRYSVQHRDPEPDSR